LAASSCVHQIIWSYFAKTLLTQVYQQLKATVLVNQFGCCINKLCVFEVLLVVIPST
jgi:hypothetical protein